MAKSAAPPALPWFLLRGPWARRRRWGGWRVPLELFGLASLIGGVGYLALVRFNAWRGVTIWDPSSAADRAIPFLPWSIYVYDSLYAYFFLPLLLTPRDDRGLLRQFYFYQGYLAVTLLSFAVFALLPCEIEIVQQIHEQGYAFEGMTGFLFESLHAVDRPWNAWPCLHVSLSLMIVLYVCRELRRPWFRWLLGLHWVLLALSVTTTKQHHLFDLATGVLLGWIGWVVLIRPGIRHVETAERVGPPGA